LRVVADWIFLTSQTNTVSGTIPVGRSPQGAAVDPKTSAIYVSNLFGDTVSVISGRVNTVTTTISVGIVGTFASPSSVAVDPKTNTAYVANPGDDTMSVLAPCPK
jgi:DNA-binding beta-propeller fold protein YncE